jgi:hypothetical protein
MTHSTQNTQLHATALLFALLGISTAVFPQQPGLHFVKHHIYKAFEAEGVALADFNRDGLPDLAYGSHWFEAPDWRQHAIRQPQSFDPATEWSDAFLHFADDIDRDGWPDVIRIGFPGKESVWYRNPGTEPGYWEEYLIDSRTCNESPLAADIDRDGRLDLVFGQDKKQEMAWFSFDPRAGAWHRYVIDGPGAPGTQRFAHGIGAGDINRDGRPDVLLRQGWWEQPADPTARWIFHEADLGDDCAQMYAYDFDADGDQDVVSSSVHNYGIWWYEQIPTDSSVAWRKHVIYDQFSQTHGLALVDINGDDLPDLVTGKRYFAHNGKDPGGLEPAVIYVFTLHRDARNKPYWIPHLVGDDSGVGMQVVVEDYNDDGKMDIITGNKKGLFIFEQK